MQKPKSIHFVGIKGVGQAPLAIIAKEAGITVTGCDIDQAFITDETLKKAGIKPLIGFDEAHVKDVDLVITTGAHGGFDNKEVVAAKANHIPILTQGEAVGAFMQGEVLARTFSGISVAGSHGKTTTTAIIATVFTEAGIDPSFVIGTGNVAALGSCGHLGIGEYFIAEADEYATEPTYNKRTKFLWQYPQIAVFTNLDLDHPDLYESEDALVKVFHEFAMQLPNDGLLVVNGDDKNLQKLLKRYSGNVITYGQSENNDYVVSGVRVSEMRTFFSVTHKGIPLGEFSISVQGEYNALNATAAIIVAMQCELSIENIQKGLKAFTGSKRRSEYKKTLISGAIVYDDYAHHPTEISKTLEAFRASFPKKHILCIFQPHTYSRTKTLFNDFTHAFSSADEVILTDIYPSLREAPDLSVSSQVLAAETKKYAKAVSYLPSLDDVVKYITQQEFDKNTIIITMGAGDVYKICDNIS